uniref:Uncharacterized protein n=1 Tax=Cacopsylla melanoneura TaxID=428564 RepID=A0A8D8WD72_9HEMI
MASTSFQIIKNHFVIIESPLNLQAMSHRFCVPCNVMKFYVADRTVVRTIHKTYRRQVLFILNDGEDSVIVNYKGSISYVISDGFGNLKFQLLHKYANLVRRKMRLNQTEVEYGGDRLTLGSLEWERSTTERIKHRKILRPQKLRRIDKQIMHQQRKVFGMHDISYDCQGKDLFGHKGSGLVGGGDGLL